MTSSLRPGQAAADRPAPGSPRPPARSCRAGKVPARPEPVHDVLGQIARRGVGDPDRLRDRRQHKLDLADRLQPDQPDPVRKGIPQPSGHVQRQPRLADPAGTGQRDQPHSRTAQQIIEVGQLDIAPDQGSQWNRQWWRIGHRISAYAEIDPVSSDARCATFILIGQQIFRSCELSYVIMSPHPSSGYSVAG